MDTKLVIFCLSAVFALAYSQDQCIQEVAQDQRFLECSQQIGMAFAKLAGAGGSGGSGGPGGPGDQSAMMTAMCSPEIMEPMKCILGFAKQCPALFASGAGGPGGMGVDLTMFESMGGFDGFCELMTPKCQELAACVGLKDGQMGAGAAPMPEPSSGNSTAPENYKTIMPELIKQVPSICNDAGKKIMCLSKYKNVCPNFVGMVVPMIKKLSDQPGSPMSYDEVHTFALKQCKNVQEFEMKKACLLEKVEHDDFVTCFRPIQTKYETDMKMTCGMYMSTNACIQKAAKQQCGKVATDMLFDASPLAVPGVPVNCDNVSSIKAGGDIDTPSEECISKQLTTNATIQSCVDILGGDMSKYSFTEECKNIGKPTIASFLDFDDDMMTASQAGYDLTIEKAFYLSCEYKAGLEMCDATTCPLPIITDFLPFANQTKHLFEYLGHTLPILMNYCDALKCLDDLSSSCPQTMDLVKHLYYLMMTGTVPDVQPMDAILFAKYKNLLKNSCPLTDAAMSTCINIQLNSNAFKDCISNDKVKVASGSKTDCRNFNLLKKCLRSHVGTCNINKATDAVISAVRFVDGKLPFDCVDSGAPTVFASVVIVMLYLFVKLV